MKLIIDCGSTKADWVLLDETRVLEKIKTEGFNPNYTDKESIIRIIENELICKDYIPYITEIYFYGSGCGNINNCNMIKEILSCRFVNASVEVNHDMMAACRAILGNRKGIACILGTGSNSACYDGNEITEQAVSLGYILGDEGSGSNIGKNLIRDFFYRKMPDDLSLKFKEEYDLNIKTTIEHLYHKQHVSKYLASFSKFAYENIDNKYIKDLYSESFDEFVDVFLLGYEMSNETEIGFVGSISYYFQDIIKQRLERKGLKLGNIMKDPIEGLVKFHCITK